MTMYGTAYGQEASSSSPEKRVDTRKPNIIFVLADDLGWAELGCYGNQFNETPNIDRLADQGVRFHQAYAAAPVCSPYRASLLTGQYPARHGILDYLRPDTSQSIDPDVTTLPELLETNGYKSGMIGKWHLSGYEYHGAEFELQPIDHGFDFQIGNEIKSVGNGANTWPYVFRNQDVRWINFKNNRLGKDEYLVDRMNLEAVEFIERNKDQPFFLYLSHYATHTILNGKKTLVDKYIKKHPPGKSTRGNCYLCEDHGHGKGDPLHHWAGDHNPHLAAMLESIDDGVGLINKKLKELGLDDNTIIVFTSDNGGETNVTSNAPLRGGKSQLYEGGIRIPLIVKWPKQVPPKSLSKQVTANIDFLPTFLEATNTEKKPKQIVDGVSILGNLKQPNVVRNDRTLFWHYPLDRPHFLGGKSAGALLKNGRWKLIASMDQQQIELFDLLNDPSESKSVHLENEQIVKTLQSELIQWRQSTRARILTIPKMVEPTKLEIGETFSQNSISQRWHFAEWFLPEGGYIKRANNGTEPKRFFVKKPTFKDSMVRFDFRIGNAKEIRLMTGSGGGYNTVIHIRPDQFFIQTAVDKSVPYFPTYQGFCRTQLSPTSWYTITVEFLDDIAIASIQNGQETLFACAQHPIIDRTREYLAVQASHDSRFDNFELYHARRSPNWEKDVLAKLQLDQSKRLLTYESETKLTQANVSTELLKEKYNFLKSNTMDRLYRNDKHYRDLLKNIDRIQNQQHEEYPKVFSIIKQVRKKITSYKKELNDSNASYIELKKKIDSAKRSLEKFIVESNPAIESAPKNLQKSLIRTASKRMKGDSRMVDHRRSIEQLEQEMEASFPRLFIKNEEIQKRQRIEREKLKNDPEFKALIRAKSEADNTAKQYLLKQEPKLETLHRLLFENK